MIWLHWAFLWLLFFLVLGRKVESLSRYTGAVCATQGWVTAWLPAFLLLTGSYGDLATVVAIVLAVFGVVAYAALYVRLRSGPSPIAPTAPGGQHVPA